MSNQANSPLAAAGSGAKRNDAMEAYARAALTAAERIVVKVGTRVLAGDTGRPARSRIRNLVSGIAALRSDGCEVILVSSGAVGMGMDALGKHRRPKNLPELQMCAAVGQARLMALYEELFDRCGIKVGQVLLTHADLHSRSRHLNARNTILTLLRHGVLPIVNENDVVSIDELRFGDNDVLAALTSVLIDAELLVLLTTVNGLRRPTKGRKTVRVSSVPSISSSVLGLANGKGGEISLGGMRSKLEATQIALQSGVPTVIADGRRSGTLQSIRAGEDVGTLIGGKLQTNAVQSSRKRWLAFFHRAQGTLVIDAGAQDALEKHGRSLLPAGVVAVRGSFEPGALVNIEAGSGQVLARGLVDYSSRDIEKIRGKRTSEIAAVLGRKDYDELIHRDNMVVFHAAPPAADR